MSTYDRRYPWMFPVDGRALPRIAREDAARIARWAGQIASRTGLKPFYNANLGNVLFAVGMEPFGGPITVPVFQNHRVRDVPSHEIDDMVMLAARARMSRSQKDKVLSRNKQLGEWQKADKIESTLAERRPDAVSYAGFLDRERRGVSKKVVTL